MKLHCIEVKFLGKYNYYHLGCLSNLNRYFKIKDVSNIYEAKKIHIILDYNMLYLII